MQIDWLTVAAQIVNFLVLVWLLKRFLYGPITAAMARREARIAERLSDAAAKQARAEAEAERYRQMQAELEATREHLLGEARDAAEQERKALGQEARETIQARKQEWLRQLASERATVLRDLRHRSTEAFYTLARRTLDDLAGAELEDQIARGFARQLAGLDDEAAAEIAEAARRADGRIRIHSRFGLGPDARQGIARALDGRLAAASEIDYAEDPGLACGIMLEAGSRRLSWSFASYLDGFEAAVEKELAGAGAAAVEGGAA